MSATKIESRTELAKALDLPVQLLTYLAWGLPDPKRYAVFTFTQSNGKVRQIEAPRSDLKVAQSRLAALIASRFSAHPAAHGFVKGRSIHSGAAKHLEPQHVVSLDLAEFFHSLFFWRIRGALKGRRIRFGDEAATLAAKLCTFEDRAATGAATSPILANAICWKLDKRLQRVGNDAGWRYSRYADDLSFSRGQNQARARGEYSVIGLERLLSKITDVVNAEGFGLNESKSRTAGHWQRQLVTGVIVNGASANVPREFVRNTRAIIHDIRTRGLAAATKRYQLRPRAAAKKRYPELLCEVLRGRLAYLRQVRSAISEEEDDVHWNLLRRAASVCDCLQGAYQRLYMSRITSNHVFDELEATELALRRAIRTGLEAKFGVDWVAEMLSLFDDESVSKIRKKAKQLNLDPDSYIHLLSFGEAKQVIDLKYDEVREQFPGYPKKRSLMNDLTTAGAERNELFHFRPPSLKNQALSVKAGQARSRLLARVLPEHLPNGRSPRAL